MAGPVTVVALAAVFLFLSGAGTGAAFANDPEADPGSLFMAEAETVEEAAAAVRMAEDEYVARFARYQELLGASGGEVFVGDPSARYQALEEFIITGIRTNIPLHQALLCDAGVISGDISTRTIEELIQRGF